MLLFLALFFALSFSIKIGSKSFEKVILDRSFVNPEKVLYLHAVYAHSRWLSKFVDDQFFCVQQS